MWFGIIFGTEFLLIAISSILLSTFQVDVFEDVLQSGVLNGCFAERSPQPA
jgi:hypothetical protein